MSGIIDMFQLALEEDLTPVLRGCLETTISSARSLIRIINDILDMSKIEALSSESIPCDPKREKQQRLLLAEDDPVIRTILDSNWKLSKFFSTLRPTPRSSSPLLLQSIIYDSFVTYDGFR